jgi:hypothetical protein
MESCPDERFDDPNMGRGTERAQSEPFLFSRPSAASLCWQWWDSRQLCALPDWTTVQLAFADGAFEHPHALKGLQRAASMKTPVVASAVFLLSAVSAHAQPVPVTPDNFVRAESDRYLAGVIKDFGLGKFGHNREPASIDHQTVIRLNRDTLYSGAVFDLDAGPVRITIPNAGKRFMSLQIISEDHYTPLVAYGPGTHTLSRNGIGTRYVLAAVRTLADPNDPKDLQQVHALQDAIKVSQPGGPGRFEMPAWDETSQKKVRDALLALASTLPDLNTAFGKKGEVDPVHRLIGTAAGWGGNPDKEAMYLNRTPSQNDGKTVYRLRVKDVPVNGFWSISLYDAKGYFEKNPLNAYTLNNITAQKESDGSVAVQFGSCDGGVPNCLPTMAGWNYLVRLYRPRSVVLNGTWKFPEAYSVGTVGSASFDQKWPGPPRQNSPR